MELSPYVYIANIVSKMILKNYLVLNMTPKILFRGILNNTKYKFMGKIEESSPNFRIRKILEFEKMSYAEFCRLSGVSESTLKGAFRTDRSPSFELLKGLTILFPKWSLNWVITGIGSMLLYDESFNVSTSISGNGNYGNVGSVSGHYLHLSSPENGKQKIIREQEIEITQESLSDERTQHKFSLLEIENSHLKQTIESLRREIGHYEERIKEKNEYIDSLKSQMNKAN